MSALPRVFPQPFESSRMVVWEPPYRAPRRVDSLDLLKATSRRGSILVLHVDGTVAGKVVSQGLLSFTRVAPWLSALLVADEFVPATTLLEMARVVGFRSCDAVLPLAPNDPRGLRRLLGSVPVDPEVVVTWAENLRPELTRVKGELLSFLWGDGALTDQRHLRDALRAARLPAPTAWTRMLGLLPAMMKLQTESSTVAETAHAAGFSDAASLSRAVYRLVRLRPIELRGVYGWKWLAHRWLRPATVEVAPRYRVRIAGRTATVERKYARTPAVASCA